MKLLMALLLMNTIFGYSILANPTYKEAKLHKSDIVLIQTKQETSNYKILITVISSEYREKILEILQGRVPDYKFEAYEDDKIVQSKDNSGTGFSIEEYSGVRMFFTTPPISDLVKDIERIDSNELGLSDKDNLETNSNQSYEIIIKMHADQVKYRDMIVTLINSEFLNRELNYKASQYEDSSIVIYSEKMMSSAIANKIAEEMKVLSLEKYFNEVSIQISAWQNEQNKQDENEQWLRLFSPNFAEQLKQAGIGLEAAKVWAAVAKQKNLKEGDQLKKQIIAWQDEKISKDELNQWLSLFSPSFSLKIKSTGVDISSAIEWATLLQGNEQLYEYFASRSITLRDLQDSDFKLKDLEEIAAYELDLNTAKEMRIENISFNKHAWFEKGFKKNQIDKLFGMVPLNKLLLFQSKNLIDSLSLRSIQFAIKHDLINETSEKLNYDAFIETLEDPEIISTNECMAFAYLIYLFNLEGNRNCPSSAVSDFLNKLPGESLEFVVSGICRKKINLEEYYPKGAWALITNDRFKKENETCSKYIYSTVKEKFNGYEANFSSYGLGKNLCKFLGKNLTKKEQIQYDNAALKALNIVKELEWEPTDSIIKSCSIAVQMVVQTSSDRMFTYNGNYIKYDFHRSNSVCYDVALKQAFRGSKCR